MNQATLIKYFETALTIADKGKVKRLFASLGYRDYQKITPEMCIDALNAHGLNFSQPFGVLVKRALKTPKVDSYIAAHGIDLLTGVTVPSVPSHPTTLPNVTVSNPQASGTSSSSSGSNWTSAFAVVTNFLIDGVNSASDLINSIKGRDVTAAQAELERQRAAAEAAKAEKAKSKILIYIVIAIIAVVAVIFGVKFLRK